MPKIKVKGQTVQAGELGQTDRHTNGRTDGRYQLHYLPRFAVDKNQSFFVYIGRSVMPKIN